MIAQIACIPPILKSQNQINNNLQRITMDTAGMQKRKLGREPAPMVAHGNGCSCNCPHNQLIAKLARQLGLTLVLIAA